MIVGLGNPGGEYKVTRHNLGFLVIDELAKQLGVKLETRKFKNRYALVGINEEEVLLVKPWNYMNNSGETVEPLRNYYKVDIANLLVISDDLDLPCGKIRIRCEGGSAGHNGLKSLIRHLGTKEFKRIRIGIGKDLQMLTMDYVLGRPQKDEIKLLREAVKLAAAAARDFIDHDFDLVMNDYNKNK